MLSANHGAAMSQAMSIKIFLYHFTRVSAALSLQGGANTKAAQKLPLQKTM
jgi:hypothetical protein